ncbi:MAG TPA: hypothetical protein ENJ19_05240 [Gammaproteobacteria bacterium]|nr:hypothetical protein [Gammaproteobacteria bacterium]
MNDELRSLARAYADGLIERNGYRQRRRELIDGITEACKEQAFSPPTQPRQRRAAPHIVPTGATSTRPAMMGIAAALLLAAAIVAFMLLGGKKTRWDTPQSPATATTAPPPSEGAGNPFDGFVQNPEWWTAARLAALKEKWRSLSAGQRRAWQSTAAYNEFEAALNRRLQQQQALAEIGDERAGRLLKELQQLRSALQQSR